MGRVRKEQIPLRARFVIAFSRRSACSAAEEEPASTCRAEGCRRRIVWSNITRTGRVSCAATDASPFSRARRQVGVWRPRGNARPTTFAVKQLPLPEPFASARSDRPLPETTFRRDAVAVRAPRGPGFWNGRVEDDEPCGREDGDSVALAAGHTVAADDVLVAAGDGDADPDKARERGPDRYTGTAAPSDGVAHDRRSRLWRQCLVGVGVRHDSGSVAVPGRIADRDTRSVRPGVPHCGEGRHDLGDRRAAGPALADVVRGAGGAGDVVVVDHSPLAVLDVDAVLSDVPDGQVGSPETVRALPSRTRSRGSRAQTC